jgi:hypothetical protein
MRKNSAGSGGTTTLALRKKDSIQQFAGYPNILSKKIFLSPSSPGRPLVELAEICLTDGALLITCIITVFILPLSAIFHSPPSDSDDTALIASSTLGTTSQHWLLDHLTSMTFHP